MKRAWGVALILPPLLLAGLWAALVGTGRIGNALVHLRVDLLSLGWLLGGSLALAGLAVLLNRLWVERWNRRALREMERSLSEERASFLRRLDHELKNPLMAIRAGMANLSGTDLQPSQRGILASIESQTLRLSRLTADLRKLAELKTRPLDRTAVDAAGLLTEVVTLAKDRAGSLPRPITLSLPQAPWPLPNVSGDRDLLFALFHNLLENAVKYTEGDDLLEVRAYEDRAQVIVEVADTGPGIPEADQPKVWEELFRGSNARGISGSGLGLALVRAIAERHGGDVSVRSRVGHGTVFTVRLPKAE